MRFNHTAESNDVSVCEFAYRVTQVHPKFVSVNAS